MSFPGLDACFDQISRFHDGIMAVDPFDRPGKQGHPLLVLPEKCGPVSGIEVGADDLEDER